MVLCTVVVPPGLLPGDEFVVAAADGQEFSISVPDGVCGDVAIEVDLPSGEPGVEEDTVASEIERVVVTVPDGVYAGETFHVQSTWGGVFELAVPIGLQPGDQLEVDLPGKPAEPTAAEAPPAPLSSQPPDEAEADSGGTYRVGERVKVQRTSGAWSPADVLEYDSVSDTYAVRLLATGQMKYMLTDNEVQPLEFQAEVAGEHFVGRRVQVPTLGAISKDEVMGEVRSYDAASNTYVVALDCGTVKRGLRPEAIKIRRPPGAPIKPPDNSTSKARALLGF